MNNYIYLLEVFATDEDGERTEKICQIEALSDESLQEQLHKVDSAIKDYESKQEGMADAEYERQKEDGEV